MAEKFNVRDYGAVGDGEAKDTAAIVRAIEASVSGGGGTVLIPPGKYLTAPIRLQSGVTLRVEEGATVLFSRNFDDYPMVPIRRMGVDVFGPSPQLYAADAKDIAITGGGVFNGQGEAWRFVKRFKLTDTEWEELVGSGGFVVQFREDLTWWPSEQAFDGKAIYDAIVARIQKGETVGIDAYAGAGDYLRPPLLQFYKSCNVLLDGPTFSNSPFWNCHLAYCDGVAVSNCTFLNPWNAQNGDGLDIDSSRNVEVRDCLFEVGDDAICIKSGRDEDGWRAGRASENIHIADCCVRRGHGGVVIGSEMSGDVRGVLAENCRLEGVMVGISFKTALGRGGVVENIEIRNITMDRVKDEAIRFNMQYAMNDPALAPLSEAPPTFRNFRLSGIRCDAAKRAILLDGLAESPIEDVALSDVQITAEQGAHLFHAKNVRFHNVRLTVSDEPALVTENVEGLELAGFAARRA